MFLRCYGTVWYEGDVVLVTSNMNLVCCDGMCELSGCQYEVNHNTCGAQNSTDKPNDKTLGLYLVCTLQLQIENQFVLLPSASLQFNRVSFYWDLVVVYCAALLSVRDDIATTCVLNRGYRGGSPTAVQAWQPWPLWEPSPSHPILL